MNRTRTLQFLKQAQLSQRDRAMLRVVAYIAKSLKVIQTGSIQKLEYGFLFAFHCNYDSILYHFRDRARNWCSIVIFHIPTAFDVPVFEDNAIRTVQNDNSF